MKIFDPANHRLRLTGDTGYEWVLSLPFEKAGDVGGLASNADADINMAVRCILVGYREPARALLARAHEWLSIAIRDNERPRPLGAPGGAEAERHHNLALCNWLITGKHDIENFSLSIGYFEQFLNGSPRVATNKMQIDLSMAHYVDAKAYAEGLSRFENARIAPPASPKRVSSEAQMAYVLCRNGLYGEFSPADIETAKTAFLKRNTNQWLTNGLFSSAAEWMKVTRWPGEETEASAWAAVLRCYDYLDAEQPKD